MDFYTQMIDWIDKATAELIDTWEEAIGSKPIGFTALEEVEED